MIKQILISPSGRFSGCAKVLSAVISLALLSVLFTFTACEKEEEDPGGDGEITAAKGVLILNEGTFNFGNASLSLYDPETGMLDNQVFLQRSGRALGDVAQSLSSIGSELYIVVNHSATIEVLGLDSLQYLTSINLPGSPRRLVERESGTALVSHLYNNKIDEVDLTSYTKSNSFPRTCEVDTINCGNEQLLIWQDKLLVSNYDANAVFVHELDDLSTYTRIEVSANVNSMQLVGDLLYVLCDGNYGQEPAMLYQIDLPSGEMAYQIVVGSLGDRATNLFDTGREFLYIQGDVYRQSYDLTQSPERLVDAAPGQVLYGVAVDPEGERLYVADAIDYVQTGVVLVYDYASLSPIDTLRTGVIPSRFLFLD